jgi:hypothetical protein
MPFTPLTFQQLQAIFATQYSAQATIPANTNSGSTLGAMANAGALMILNVQQELIYVDDVARAATSTGSDLDSFWNPFNLIRYGQASSSGTVTMSSASPVSMGQIVIPVGGIVSTSGGLQFNIQADPTNTTGFFSTTFNGYIISGGASSANVLVTCATGGAVGNVSSGQITQVYNGAGLPVISGISIVTNANPFINGTSSETDVEYLARCTTTISTGVVGTPNALIGAVLAVQPGLTYSFGDGLNISGASSNATVTVVVNAANTGVVAPSSLITAVQAALNAARSAGITVQAIGPALTTVSVSATVHCAVGTNTTTLTMNLVGAVQSYINGIGLNPNGGTTEADYFSIGAALLAVTGVTKIDSLLINSGTTDIVAAFGHQLVAGSATFTISAP